MIHIILVESRHITSISFRSILMVLRGFLITIVFLRQKRIKLMGTIDIITTTQIVLKLLPKETTGFYCNYPQVNMNCQLVRTRCFR